MHNIILGIIIWPFPLIGCRSLLFYVDVFVLMLLYWPLCFMVYASLFIRVLMHNYYTNLHVQLYVDVLSLNLLYEPYTPIIYGSVLCFAIQRLLSTYLVVRVILYQSFCVT